MKRAATALLDFIAVSLLFLVICLGDKVSAGETKNKIPEYKFENKDYIAYCDDKKPGACEHLIDGLKRLEREKREAVERARKQVDLDMMSGTSI